MSIARPLSDAVADLVQSLPLRAAGFIVTLYGDAVVPRGGAVWIGTIIETCATVGISETLVRTAVSRLVASGQLEGWRRGKRSYYRLSDGAGTEFEAAGRLIYGPPEAWQWRFLHLPADTAEAEMARLERQGYARLRPQLAVGPARGPVPKGLLAFDGDPHGALDLLPGFAALGWDLAPHAQAYRDLIDRFSPLDGLVPDETAAGDGAMAMAARLLLVHAWRGALLRDPRLPAAALPADWPGHAARALFHRLYAALSPAADSHAGRSFEGANGPLPAITPAIEARMAANKDKPDQGLRGSGLRTG